MLNLGEDGIEGHGVEFDRRFLFGLARELKMTVGEIQHGRGTPMSSEELQEWRVFFKIEAAEEKQKRDHGQHGDSDNPTPRTMGSSRA
jgi:hypothetical protein